MLEKKESLILELLKIADVISPGNSTIVKIIVDLKKYISFSGLSNFRRALICDFFENIVDIRREAGLTDENSAEKAVGPSHLEFKLIYENFCMDGLIYSKVK